MLPGVTNRVAEVPLATLSTMTERAIEGVFSISCNSGIEIWTEAKKHNLHPRNQCPSSSLKIIRSPTPMSLSYDQYIKIEDHYDKKIHLGGWMQTCCRSASSILMPAIPRWVSWSKSSRMFRLLPSPSSQRHFACMSKRTHTDTSKKTQNKQETDTLISEILHKFHNYNAHHSFRVPPC